MPEARVRMSETWKVDLGASMGASAAPVDHEFVRGLVGGEGEGRWV